jgi:CRP/FNR family transcriptional regulator, anaerobic regulatory protein
MWLEDVGFSSDVDDISRSALTALKPVVIDQGHVVFRPGETASGFFVVLSGRIGVYLTGLSGREMRLYEVEAGQTCIQTTLGLLGEKNYGGEAVAESHTRAIVIPRAIFLDLMNRSAWFRHFVFHAFAARIGDITRVLEQVAFVKVEQRLASELLAQADIGGLVTATHQELAVAIGSVREVVSRRLEAFARSGLVVLERGQISIADLEGLRRSAAG